MGPDNSYPFDTEDLPGSNGQGAIIAGHPFGCSARLGSGNAEAEEQHNPRRYEGHTTS